MAHRSSAHRKLTLVWAATVAATLSLAMFGPVSAIPTAFTWGSYDASGSTAYGVYEVDAATPLSTGDLVQFIWAGPDDVIDPPKADGTPGGDDEVLQTGTVQNGGSLPPSARSRGYVPFQTYSYDTDDPGAGGVVYLRAWNAPSASGDSAYGDSIASVLTAYGEFNAPRWSVTGEPTSVQVVGLAYNRGGVWPVAAIVAGTLSAIAVVGAIARPRLMRNRVCRL